MSEEGIFRRRHLPHWDVGAKPYFITACLEGSICAAGLRSLKAYREQIERRPRPPGVSPQDWESRKGKLVFAFIDNLLDGECPVSHLRSPTLAAVVVDAFLHFAGERYDLLAFVVMPSHHHWLFTPREAWVASLERSTKPAGRFRSPREIISHSVQSYTANRCNRLLETTGPFWQHETFDHWIRDEAEMHRVISYIEGNPVKAGLTRDPASWRWSSASYRSLTLASPGDPILKPRAVEMEPPGR